MFVYLHVEEEEEEDYDLCREEGGGGVALLTYLLRNRTRQL